MSDKSCENSDMSCEASILVKRVAEPRGVGDSVKAAISRAAHRLGWKHSRTRDIWYARARRIDAHEMDALRRQAAKEAARYESVARAMEQTDPDFYRSDIIALVRAARALRGVDLPGDDGE